MRRTILILALFKLLHLHSQVPVKLSFNNEFVPTDTVCIYEYYAGNHRLVNVINPFVNAEYSLAMPSHAGQFLIQLKGHPSMAQFIYNPADALSIGIRKSELKSGIIFFSEDRENACYNYVMKASAIYDFKMDSVQRLLFNLDKSNPLFNKTYKTLDSLYYTIAFEKNYTLSYVRFMYEHSYCDQTIIPLLLIPLVPPLEKATYNSWIHYTIQNYLEHANVNQQLLYNNLLETQMIRYLNLFGNAPNWSAALSVTRLVDKFNTDSVVMAYVGDCLMKIALKAESYPFARWVDEKVSKGCTVNRLDWDMLYTKQSKKVFVGGFVENTSLFTLNGKKSSLFKHLKKGDNWLLFYTQPCDSLYGYLNSFVRLSQKNASDNRIAIYMGNNKTEWMNLVKQLGLNNWIHISEMLPAADGLLTKNLLINRTPTLFRLDGNGYILKRYLVPANY